MIPRLYVAFTTLAAIQVLAVRSAFYNSSKTEPENKLISNILNQHSEFSTITFVVQGNGFVGLESISEIVCTTNRSYVYRILYFPSDRALHSITNFAKSHFLNLGGNFAQNLPGFVILITMDYRQLVLKSIFSLICAPYLPITRKDTDVYIFKVILKNKSSNFVASLLSDPNVESIRLKIIIKILDGRVIARVVTKFCEWSICDFEYDDTINLKYLVTNNKPVNMKGTLLRIAVPNIESEIEFTQYSDQVRPLIRNAKRGSWKYLFENYLMVKFNFTYTMIRSTGGGTGLKLPNGTWIGVTGDLINKRVDLGIATAKTPDRHRVIGFTDSFYLPGHLEVVTTKPTEYHSPIALLWPFQFKVWILLFCLGLFGLGFLLISSKVSLIISENTKSTKWSPKTHLLFLAVPFIEHDVPCLKSASNSLRIFTALWLIFAVIVTSAYRSQLSSQWAFPLFSDVPQTFKELIDSPDYKIGFLRQGDSAYSMLTSSTNPVYKKLLKEMEMFQGVGWECLERVITGSDKFACIGYDFSLRYLQHKKLSDEENQKIIFLKEAKTYNIFLGITTPPNSIYRKYFGKYLAYAQQFHLERVWYHHDMFINVRMPKLKSWLNASLNGNKSKTDNKHEFMKSRKDTHSTLTIKQILGVVYLSIIGFFMASLFFCCELFIRNCCYW